MALNNIMFLGDVHGNIDVLTVAMENAARLGIDTIIQVGDFWLYSDDQLEKISQIATRVEHQFGTRPVIHFIDGNHEDYRLINPHGVTTHYSDTLIYHPRGDVFIVHETTIGCFGGAISPDKDYRTPGKDWFEQELPTHQDVMRTMRHVHRGVDVMVTHEVPQFALSQVAHTVRDQSLLYTTESVRFMVEDVLDASQAPLIVHGHWHYPHTQQYGHVTVVSLAKETQYGSMMVVDEDHGVYAVTKQGLTKWSNNQEGKLYDPVG